MKWEIDYPNLVMLISCIPDSGANYETEKKSEEKEIYGFDELSQLLNEK